MKRQLVQSETAVTRMVEELAKHETISIDFETRPGEWVDKPDLAGVGFACHNGNGYEAWYVPMHTDLGITPYVNLNEDLVLSKIKPICENQNIGKVAHGADVESGHLKHRGIETGHSIRCSQLVTWLYHEEDYYPYRLKEIVPRLLGMPIKTLEQHVGKKVTDYGKVPLDIMTLYNTDDTIGSLRLHEWCEPELKRQGLWEDYTQIEVPLVNVLRDMMIRGIQIDIGEACRQRELAVKRQGDLESLMYMEAGYPFNVRSRQQFSKILFDELHYPYPDHLGYTEKNHEYKTSDDVMKWVAEQGAPMAKFFREYGDLDKKRGTDLERLIQGVDSSSRYHTSIWQCGTKTGRFSSDFQQVPRDAMFFCPQCGGFTLGFVLKDEAGVEWYQCSCHNKQDVPLLLKLLSFIDIRRLVIPREGHTLVVCDYNQLELRLIAHFSRDPILTSAYRNGLDLHKITGENLNIPRQDAKPVNFGLAYGLTRNSLVELFGEEKADEVYPLLRERYKVLMKYTTSVHQAARETGFTRTIAGRKRRVPLINTGDRYERGHAERQSFNSKMQGSAADLVKMAQRDLAAKVPEFKQVLQVHDEVVGEVEGPPKKVAEVAREVKRVMESYSKYLEVPLLCEPKPCPHWRAGK